MSQLIIKMEILLTDRKTAAALGPECLPIPSPSLSTILRGLPMNHEIKGYDGHRLHSTALASIYLLWLSVVVPYQLEYCFEYSSGYQTK